MDIIEQAIQVSDEKASIYRPGILHFSEKRNKVSVHT